MRTFLIAYELARPNHNKHDLAQAVMQLGGSWARPLDNIWYVRTTGFTGRDITMVLSMLLDGEMDGLMVQEVQSEAVLTNASLRWFRQRRPAEETAEDVNVISFPKPAGEDALGHEQQGEAWPLQKVG